MSVRRAVDRGLQIIEEMRILQIELKGIELQLEAAGLEGEQIELVDPDREGRQYLARGSSAIVPVVFTADLLTKSFTADSAVHQKIAGAAGVITDGALGDFFALHRVFKTVIDSGKSFRARSAEVFGEKAPAFISACLQRDKHGIPKSQTKIDWSRAEQLDGRALSRPESEAA